MATVEPRVRHSHRRRWLFVLGVLAVGAGAGWWYLNSADVPPVYVDAPDLTRLPLVGRADAPVAPLQEAELAHATQALDAAAKGFASARLQARTLLEQLQAVGLPVTAAAIEETSDGKRALMLSAPYSSTLPGFAGSGLTAGVRQLARLGEASGIDLAGLDEVVLFLRDDDDRTLFSVAAPTSTLLAYRAGTASQGELIRTIAIRAESRAAALEGQLP